MLRSRPVSNMNTQQKLSNISLHNPCEVSLILTMLTTQCTLLSLIETIEHDVMGYEDR